MSDSQGGSSNRLSSEQIEGLKRLLEEAQREFEWAKGSLILRHKGVGREVLALNRGLHQLRNARSYLIE